MMLSAKQLIAHLEAGLKALSVEDAPVVLWTRDSTTGIEPEGMGPSHLEVLGFVIDSTMKSIHLRPGVSE